MSTSKFSGITLMKGKSYNDAELLELAKSFSSKKGDAKECLLHWDFGPIMEMKFNALAPNYLFSGEAVPMHWDGAFYIEPKKLLFYCTETNGSGGETLFVNTELLWDSLSPLEQEECKKVKLKYTTEKKAHYGGEIIVPLVQKHPETKRTILRMAEKVETELNPVKLEIIGISDPEDFYNRMQEKLYDQAFLYTHYWQKGDVLLCDNYTYLHGRAPLRDNLSRSFKRIQIL